MGFHKNKKNKEFSLSTSETLMPQLNVYMKADKAHDREPVPNEIQMDTMPKPPLPNPAPPPVGLK